MSLIENESLAAVRRSPVYRTAVWVARLANLVLIPSATWELLSIAGIAPAMPDTAFFVAVAVGGGMLLSATVLFHRAVVAFVGKDLRWDDRQIGNAILWDVFLHRQG